MPQCGRSPSSRSRRKAPPPRYTRGYGAIFAQNVTQANEGCDFAVLADRSRVPEPDIYYQYPSLIDHASISPVFDRADGDLYLYMTRYNLFPDRSDGGNRDLVRLRVAIEPQ